MHIQDPAQRAWIQQRVEGIQHQHRAQARGQARDPRPPHRGRDVRALHPPQVGRHQALRPRRRRIDDPGARADRAARGRARRRGDRDRHAAPRAPQRARERDAQALSRDLRRVQRQHRRLRRLRLGRRQVSHGHVDRPDRARPQAPPLAHGESLAPRGRRSGRARQGAREAGPARRQDAPQRDGPAAARRRRVRGPGPRGRDADALRARGLRHGRHVPPDRQQPDRLHHRSDQRALGALLLRRGPDGAGCRSCT